jgi:hypothetical protein
MKLLSILLLTVVLSKGCTEDQKQTMESSTIEYTATTRGFNQKIIVNNKTFKLTRNLRGKDTLIQNTISDKDWNDLVLAFQDINLDELQNLKSPTEKRFYDGAAIANLKIIHKDKSYESNSFDHGFPPQEIEKLVTKINSLAINEQ